MRAQRVTQPPHRVVISQWCAEWIWARPGQRQRAALAASRYHTSESPHSHQALDFDTVPSSALMILQRAHISIRQRHHRYSRLLTHFVKTSANYSFKTRREVRLSMVKSVTVRKASQKLLKFQEGIHTRYEQDLQLYKSDRGNFF